MNSWGRPPATLPDNGVKRLVAEGGATKLADLFKATAWRATKNRVDHAIPPQRSVLRHLTFDAVERFVYDRLDEACARDLAALTGDAVNEACSLQGGGVSRLRQACVHPSLAMPRRKRRKRKKQCPGGRNAGRGDDGGDALAPRRGRAAQGRGVATREVVPPLRARGRRAVPRRFGWWLCCFGYEEDAPGVVAALARTTRDHLKGRPRTLYETALKAILDGRDAATGLRVPRDDASVKTNERLSLGRARRVVRVAIKASSSIDVRLESKNPEEVLMKLRAARRLLDEWTTIDVTKPHEAKAEEWRLASKHDGTVEARFYESRVDSDWALELHCLHNLAATKELLGDDGSDEKEGAQRIRNRQGAARFDRVSGAVHQLERLRPRPGRGSGTGRRRPRLVAPRLADGRRARGL